MAFQQGLSGLSVASKALDVTSNNIANSATVGFKAGQAHFADVYAASLTGASGLQAGIGATVAAITQQFTQGNVTTTANPLDLAINGQGFYRLDNNGAPSYTRNGQFHVDKDGFVVNDQGFNLSGYPAPGGIVVPSTPQAIQISASDLAPKITEKVTATVNLDARKTVPEVARFDPTQPLSYTSSTALTIFDSQGNDHTFTMYFRKVAANTWDVYTNDVGTGDPNADPPVASTVKRLGDAGSYVTPAIASFDYSTTPASFSVNSTVVTLNQNYTDLAGLAAAVQTQLGASYTVAPDAGGLSITDTFSASAPTVIDVTGTIAGAGSSSTGTTSLVFNSDGTLAATSGKFTQIVTSPLSNGSTLGKDLGNGSFGFPFEFVGTTQYGNTFSVNQLTQDGFTTGRLAGLNVSKDGVLQGRYTNGQSRPLAQIVLANFTNPNGLVPIGNNQWTESSESGPPLVGQPDTGRLGVIQSAAVEDSNTDLTAELVNLITQQRNYQANAQSIRTQDQILNTLVNLR